MYIEQRERERELLYSSPLSYYYFEGRSRTLNKHEDNVYRYVDRKEPDSFVLFVSCLAQSIYLASDTYSSPGKLYAYLWVSQFWHPRHDCIYKTRWRTHIGIFIHIYTCYKKYTMSHRLFNL